MLIRPLIRPVLRPIVRALHQRGGGFSPLSLFAAGEKGAHFEVITPAQNASLQTMFQDSAGATLVSAVEQPDGLWLDTKRGSARGVERVTNGEFGNNIDGWSGVGGTLAAWEAGTMKLTAVATTGGYYQDVTVPAGSLSEVVVRVRKLSGSSNVNIMFTPRADFAAPNTQTTVTSAEYVYVRAIMKPDATTIRVYLQMLGGDAVAQVDSVSVRELPGNHATQATSTSRPVVSARYNLFDKSNQFSDPSWNKVRATVTEGVAATPDGTPAAKIETNATNAGGAYINKTGLVTVTGAKYRTSWRCKAGNKAWVVLNIGDGTADYSRQWFNLAAGTLGATSVAGVGLNASNPTVVPVGDGWYDVSLDVIADTTTVVPNLVGCDADASFNTTLGDYFYAARGDFRTASDAALNIPSYQRVNTASDYDTAGFPHYEALDGTDDGIGITSTAGFLGADMDVFILSTRRSAGNAVALSNDVTGTSFLGVMASGDASLSTSGAGGTWKTFVNGVQVGGTATTTRDQLHAAFPANSTKVLEFQNVDLSTWAKLVRGSYTGFMLNSRDYAILVCPAQSDATRARIRRYLANKVGMTL